ncbi:MAG: NAD-dependent epimerase/dehydratase family protein [Syntrophothermus sp.]
MKIAILGATSHIAKGLISRFIIDNEYELFLYSRSFERAENFLKLIDRKDNGNYRILDDYGKFQSLKYDLIINCIGVETRNKHNCDFSRYFSLTEEFDNLVVGYLQKINEDAQYISFSSGAVYGKGFSSPADEDSENCIAVNKIAPEDYYSIVRINAETKHRSLNNLRIIDLRVFSYFSRFINIEDGYFITDVIQSVIKKQTLITDKTNMVRDYIHPEDLFAAVKKCPYSPNGNCAVDLQSLSPVSKQEVLDYFSVHYGLQYKIHESSQNESATGTKLNYYSVINNAALIDFRPVYRSINSLAHESEILIKNKLYGE